MSTETEAPEERLTALCEADLNDLARMNPRNHLVRQMLAGARARNRKMTYAGAVAKAECYVVGPHGSMTTPGKLVISHPIDPEHKPLECTTATAFESWQDAEIFYHNMLDRIADRLLFGES